MPRLRLGRSYWLDVVAGTAPRFPAFGGDRRADIAIVGGGLTGCAAALLFARAGASVILVESARIGRGSTAASTALLMQEPDTDFTELSERYGPARARRIWRRCRASVRALRRTLAALGTPSLEARPSVYFTRDAARVGALEHEAAARRRAGFPGRWCDAADVRDRTGIDAEGAILTAGNAQVDPYRACLAIARGAAARGARLFERSTVQTVKGTRKGVTVTLDDGTITADWAVIATGYATPAFKPLAARFKMMNTYVIATPRIPAAVRRRMGLGEVMMWDTERPYHYLRWTPDHRVLFGGLDRPQLPRAVRPAALRRRASELMTQLIGLYPALEGMRPEYAWEGLFAATPDGLPYVGAHRRYPRHLFALGYGGNGMTLGFGAAQILARTVQGRPAPDDGLFAFARARGLPASRPRAGRSRD